MDDWDDLELVDVGAQEALGRQALVDEERVRVRNELVLIEAQEALQAQVAELSTPVEVEEAIAACLRTHQVPPEREEGFLRGARLRLHEVAEEVESELRADLVASSSVPMIDAVSAKAEEAFGGINSGIHEEITVARNRRVQFLEMELETKWSRPFAGPLPLHARAARRYELELGANHRKVVDFVREEKRYRAALEANFEAKLAKLQVQRRKLTLQREEARARAVREQLDERLSEVAAEVRDAISRAIVGIGADNAIVTRRALELLSVDEHASVYSLQAEDAAGELRIELSRVATSPEAADRRRGFAVALRALLDVLTPLHPLQKQLRTEFAEALETLAPPPTEPAAPSSEPPSPVPRLVLASAVTRAGSSEGTGTEREPEEEDVWAMPPGFEEIVAAPQQEEVVRKLPHGGLPDTVWDFRAAALPQLDVVPDADAVVLLETFMGENAVLPAAPLRSAAPLALSLTLPALTWDTVRLHTEPVLSAKLARAISEALGVERHRIKVANIEQDPVRALLTILEPEHPTAARAPSLYSGDSDFGVTLDDLGEDIQMDAAGAFAELERQLENPASRLRLGDVGPFLIDASVEKAGPNFGPKVDRGSLAGAFTAPWLGGDTVDFKGKLGATLQTRSMDMRSTAMPTSTLGTTTSDGWPRSTWGTARLEPGCEQAESRFRTTCPHATEDGTSQPWALPFERQPLYSFYDRNVEEESREPLVKLPANKFKFASHAKFSLTRFPGGSEPKMKAQVLQASHLAAANSWLQSAEAKLSDPLVANPLLFKDLSLKDPSLAESLFERTASSGKLADSAVEDDPALSGEDSPVARRLARARTKTGAFDTPEPEPEDPAVGSPSSGKATSVPVSKPGSPKVQATPHGAAPQASALLAGARVPATPTVSVQGRPQRVAAGQSPTGPASPAATAKNPSSPTAESTQKASQQPSKLRVQRLLRAHAEAKDKEKPLDDEDELSEGSPDGAPNIGITRRRGAEKPTGGRQKHAKGAAHAQSESDGGLAVPRDFSHLDSSKAFDSACSSYVGMHGGLPNTGLRRIYDKQSGTKLPALVGKPSAEDFRSPAYVRQAYRHGTVGIGPPYKTNQDGAQDTPQWTALQMLDATLEKADWKRTYSNVAKNRCPKLGPQENIRAVSRSVSLPQVHGTRRPGSRTDLRVGPGRQAPKPRTAWGAEPERPGSSDRQVARAPEPEKPPQLPRWAESPAATRPSRSQEPPAKPAEQPKMPQEDDKALGKAKAKVKPKKEDGGKSEPDASEAEGKKVKPKRKPKKDAEEPETSEVPPASTPTSTESPKAAEEPAVPHEPEVADAVELAIDLAVRPSSAPTEVGSEALSDLGGVEPVPAALTSETISLEQYAARRFLSRVYAPLTAAVEARDARACAVEYVEGLVGWIVAFEFNGTLPSLQSSGEEQEPSEAASGEEAYLWQLHPCSIAASADAVSVGGELCSQAPSDVTLPACSHLESDIPTVAALSRPGRPTSDTLSSGASLRSKPGSTGSWVDAVAGVASLTASDACYLTAKDTAANVAANALASTWLRSHGDNDSQASVVLSRPHSSGSKAPSAGSFSPSAVTGGIPRTVASWTPVLGTGGSPSIILSEDTSVVELSALIPSWETSELAKTADPSPSRSPSACPSMALPQTCGASTPSAAPEGSPRTESSWKPVLGIGGSPSIVLSEESSVAEVPVPIPSWEPSDAGPDTAPGKSAVPSPSGSPSACPSVALAHIHGASTPENPSSATSLAPSGLPSAGPESPRVELQAATKRAAEPPTQQGEDAAAMPDATRRRFMTNSAATRQQVQSFAQSLTAHLFRTTQRQAAEQLAVRTGNATRRPWGSGSPSSRWQEETRPAALESTPRTLARSLPPARGRISSLGAESAGASHGIRNFVAAIPADENSFFM